MNTRRRADAGVSLIEMLIVLALFGVVAAGVALSLPGPSRDTSSEVAARGLAAHLERAVGLTLANGTGFGVLHTGENLRFVERDASGQWQLHSDPPLARVKLSVEGVRMALKETEVFAVSDRLIPSTSTPFRAEFGAGPRPLTVHFDGAVVRLEEGG